VPASEVREALDVTSVNQVGRRGKERTVELGLCPSCRDRQALADRIVAAHPQLVAARGNGSAPRLVANVLDSLAVVEEQLPAYDLPDRDLGALIHHLCEPGAHVAWRWRVATAARVQKTVEPPSTSPFSYLASEEVAAVRRGYAAYLHERAVRDRGPQRLSPPEGSDRPGCLLCGVGAVEVPAQRVARQGVAAATRAVWFPLVVSSNAIGGSGGAPIRGHVCPPCADAVQAVGAVGPTALSRALAASLRSQGLSARAIAIEYHDERVARGAERARSTLRGWGALPPTTPPSARPWAHLGRMEAVG
jgi:hypothetical protein